MTNTEKNQLIADVARDIIEQTEPAELPLFRAISREYFKRPAEARKNQSGRDEMLGLGIGEAVFLFEASREVIPARLTSPHLLVNQERSAGDYQIRLG
jgi:hypothetical protein